MNLPLVQLFELLDQVRSRLAQKSFRGRRNGRPRAFQFKAAAAQIELLEQRALLSAASVLNTTYAEPTVDLAKPAATSGPTGYSPSQIQTAYGFNQVSLQSGANGTGQTIAIVDAYNDPTIQSDLQAFDKAYGLANPSSLTVMSQTGSTTSLPAPDSTKGWELEEALDVEWAHALAPGAKIVLVEANSSSYADLLTAVNTAEHLSGVSVVSMSWGGSEFSSESSYDSYFTTPSGHQGVTFVASTGDNAAPGGFPAYSPNVLAVGGTTLTISSSGSYISESAWANSGGGISQYESQPSYQTGTVTQTTTKRAIPDVSFDANPNTGVAVYDSYTNGTTNPWSQVGGTSLSAPSWAAIVSIVNQARVQNGQGTLDGATQTLPMLYQLDKTTPSAFHDITTGSNGYSAGTGYDLVTGLGSPVVNVLVSSLSGTSTPTSTSHLAFQQSPSTGTAGQLLGTIKVAVENQSGQVVTTDNSTITLSIASGAGGFANTSTVSVQAVNGVATFTNLLLDTSGNYTISASDGSLTGATSSNITISAAQAAKVVFQQSPTTGTVSQALSTVTVAIEDQFGNIVTSNSSVVTISVASGPGNFTSGSTLSVAAVNGIATFNNLVLATAGSYTLKVSDGSLTTATTGSLTVGAGLAAPQNVSLVALNTTTAQLSWNAVSGTQGYRVYEIIGSQAYLLGTVSSSTTSVQINGLTPGATFSFKVEAYSGATVADSQVVSVTMPSTSSSSLTVTATVLSATSVQLSWNPISGAQGYRIYVEIGSTQYLLGSVSSAMTSVTIYGLVPGTTYQFLIQAYHGSTVQNSNWVAVNSSSAIRKNDALPPGAAAESSNHNDRWHSGF